MATEDDVRKQANVTLFADVDRDDVKYGTGQITTFNELGFTGDNHRPDGWWLPEDSSESACVFEFKALGKINDDGREELKRNMRIVGGKYGKVCGAIWDGQHVEVYLKDGDCWEERSEEITLKHVSKYLEMFDTSRYDSERIQEWTMRINNALHFDFGMMNLKHRMLFTACALVAVSYRRDEFVTKQPDGTYRSVNRKYRQLKDEICHYLEERINEDLSGHGSLGDDRKYLKVMDLVSICRNEVKANNEDIGGAPVDNLVDAIAHIAERVSSDNWQGDDVMAIFFNEFTRYRGKSEAGQVFTPDHICGFICKLLEVNEHDRVLDACCGSGTFLTKAMRQMVQKAGGWGAPGVTKILTQGIYGIEFDREIYALACANMLMHKDGKTNLRQMDARDPRLISSKQRRKDEHVHNDAGDWIRRLNITKVLMNPPYERKYHCMAIVENVLDSVACYDERTHSSLRQVDCAFIMPDKKLEKESKKVVQRILSKHRLVKVLKLPDIFFGVGVSASVFVFRAGLPQNDEEFWACDLKDDGFEVVKVKGRKDVRDKWHDIEQEWLQVCRRTPEGGEHNGQWHTVDECMSYQEPEKPFEIYEEDFRKTALDFLLFQMRERERESGEVSDINALLLRAALYQSRVEVDADGKKQLVIELGE